MNGLLHTQFVAHIRAPDSQARQSLENHLRGVGCLSEEFAVKLGLSKHGRLMGCRIRILYRLKMRAKKVNASRLLNKRYGHFSP